MQETLHFRYLKCLVCFPRSSWMTWRRRKVSFTKPFFQRCKLYRRTNDEELILKSTALPYFKKASDFFPWKKVIGTLYKGKVVYYIYCTNMYMFFSNHHYFSGFNMLMFNLRSGTSGRLRQFGVVMIWVDEGGLEVQGFLFSIGETI